MKILSIVGLSGIGIIGVVAYNFIMPEVQISVRVVDQAGLPVNGAEVVAWFPHIYGPGASPEGESKQVLTNAEGIAFLTGHTVDPVSFGARKSGFYESGGGQVDFMKIREEGRPLKAERKIVLKKILNPIPMVARWFPQLAIPGENASCGFDFEIGDWVAPRGNGKHPDIIFNITGKYVSYKEFDAVLEITFPNKGDGLVCFEGQQHIGSELISDYHAPEAGYIPELKLAKRAAAGQTTSQWLDESKPGSNYYFRVRTVLDEKGEIVSAHYGKIYGRFEFGRYKGAESLYLKSGTYYFNPAANDRNVEFDRSKNLATDVTRSDKVSLP